MFFSFFLFFFLIYDERKDTLLLFLASYSFSQNQLTNIHREDTTNKLKPARHQIYEIIIHDPHLPMHIFHQD